MIVLGSRDRMTAMPPEPDFSPTGSSVLPPEPPTIRMPVYPPVLL
jgi:hypothetical protein